jgi:hypothetical protein
MRALVVCLLLLVPASDIAFAQTKAPTKSPAPANETRYFTAIDGFMDGADVVLKETRQGKAVSAAVLDVCYSPEKGNDRKDRFVANLAVNGQALTGTTQSLGDKTPVTVKLNRKPTGETFEFKGTVSIGAAVSEVASSDNSDLSEKEFQENQSTDDGIAAAPKDFTEVSPEAIAVKVKVDAAQDFLKGLKGQNVEVLLSSLSVSCDALRAGEQVLTLAVDPDRAATFIAKAKASPGVVAAGWTSGVVDMDRSIRFAAADWRDGDKLNRDKMATTIAAVLSKTLSAKLSSAAWSDDTGKLKLVFKRPSTVVPALQLTETLEINALAGPDKPGATDRLMLWVSSPSVSTADESAGAKLSLNDDSGGDEEAEPKDDGGAIDALAKEFKGQRWDSDKAAWK